MTSLPDEYGRVLDALGDATVVSDLEGRIVYLNPAALALTGWRLDELAGQPLTTLMPERLRARHLVGFGRYVRTRVPTIMGRPVRVPLLRKDRVELEIELTLAPFPGDLIVASLRDLRDRVELERQTELLASLERARAERERTVAEQGFLAEASEVLLRASNHREALAQITRMAVPLLADWCAVALVSGGEPDVIALAHLDPSEIDLIRALRWRIGWSPAHGIGKVLRTGEAELVEEIPDEMLVSRAPDAASLAQMRSLRLGSAMIIPMKARGRILGAFTFANETSSRRFGPRDLSFATDLAHRAALAVDNSMLYEQAQEAVRLRDNFLSIASHELRTPLTPLQIQLESLEQALRTGAFARTPEARRMAGVQRSLRQVQRLSALVDNLLDVSRIQTGRLALAREPIDLGELVREVVDRFREDSTLAGSSLELVAQSNVVGCWDRLRIEQVVTNLLSNAEKYGAGKPICVDVSADDRSACLAVADRGIGIAPEEIGRIFGRFERAVDTYGGLGLGLYIVREVLEAHGGTISVESRPGAGSRFTVTLPLSSPT